jgi:hypothetical protein
VHCPIDLVNGRSTWKAARPAAADEHDRDLDAQWQAFVAALPRDTGRDLAAWADLIAHFTDKNDAIDFLRGHAGLSFQHASWVERWQHARQHGYRGPFGHLAESQWVAQRTRNTRQSGRAQATAPRAGYRTARGLSRGARAHASALLVHLQDTRLGEEVLAAEVERIYEALCEDGGWQPLRWRHRNGVAQHLRALMGHPKTYRDVLDAAGGRQRLSVYPVSALASVPLRGPRGAQQTAQQTRLSSVAERAAVAA